MQDNHRNVNKSICFLKEDVHKINKDDYKNPVNTLLVFLKSNTLYTKKKLHCNMIHIFLSF